MRATSSRVRFAWRVRCMTTTSGVVSPALTAPARTTSTSAAAIPRRSISEEHRERHAKAGRRQVVPVIRELVVDFQPEIVLGYPREPHDEQVQVWVTVRRIEMLVAADGVERRHRLDDG